MNLYYEELKVTPPSDYYELILSYACDLFEEAIEEYEDSFILRSESSLKDIQKNLEDFCHNLSALHNQKIDCIFTYSQQSNEDWINLYKESVSPVDVGDFYVHPSWYEEKNGRINIIIDPALAFGSGQHETTAGCLKAISKYIKIHDTVLDVGCGSGILSIASALKHARVWACDTDSVATESTYENCRINNVSLENIWTGSINNSPKKEFNVVIANIVADVLIFLSDNLINVLQINGILILSGILNSLSSKVEKEFSSSLLLVEKFEGEEWTTLVYQKKGN